MKAEQSKNAALTEELTQMKELLKQLKTPVVTPVPAVKPGTGAAASTLPSSPSGPTGRTGMASSMDRTPPSSRSMSPIPSSPVSASQPSKKPGSAPSAVLPIHHIGDSKEGIQLTLNLPPGVSVSVSPKS